MNVDTGKAIVSQFNDSDNIILVDIYSDDQIDASDLEAIHDAIDQFDMDFPVDTICVKSGKFTMTEDAHEFSHKNHVIHNKIVYVIKHMSDIHFPVEAEQSWFKDHLVDYCASVSEAYQIITQH